MFGNTKPLPAEKPDVAGLDESRVPSNEAGKIVPYLAGTQRLGIATYLEDYFNPVFKEHHTIDKKDKGGNTLEVEAYAGFAGLLCVGMVNRLNAIYYDKKRVWEGELDQADYGDSVNVTLPELGVLTFFFGTETQDVSTLFEAGDGFPGAPNIHPGYRGQCVVGTKKFSLGLSTSWGGQYNLKELEFVVSRWPVRPWFSFSANSQGDCNPVALVADWLQDKRFGAGLPDARLNTTHLNSVAEDLQTRCISVSPIETSAQSLRQLFIKLFQPMDGHLVTFPNGTISMNTMTPPTASGDLLSIDERHLLEEPNLETQGWDETFNRSQVIFTNRENEFKKDAVTWSNSANVQITNQVLPQTFEMPWVTRPRFAAILAAVMGRRNGNPTTSGTLRVRKSAVTGMKAGDAFNFSYGHYGICNLLMRCLEINFPAADKQEAQIVFTVDQTGIMGDPFDISDYEPPTKPVIVVEPITKMFVVQHEYGMRFKEWKRAIGFLAARPTPQTTAYFVHRLKPGGSYEMLPSPISFVQYGRVVDFYPAATTLIDDAVKMVMQLEGVDLDLPAVQFGDALQNELLVCLANEMLSIYDVELLDAGKYRFSCIRNRFGTRRYKHDIGDGAWVFPRKSLYYWEATDELLHQYFKFQPVVITTPQDLAEIEPRQEDSSDNGLRPFAPLNLRVNGTIGRANYSSGVDLVFEWDLTATDREGFWPEYPVDTLRSAVSVFRLDTFPLGTVVGSQYLPAGTTTYTLPHAEIITAFGADVPLVAYVSQARNGRFSRAASPLILNPI